jgi:hypothetical protein
VIRDTTQVAWQRMKQGEATGVHMLSVVAFEQLPPLCPMYTSSCWLHNHADALL